MTIQEVEAVMTEILRGAELIIAGDFNVDLEGMDGRGRDEEITAGIVKEGLEDIAGNLLL